MPLSLDQHLDPTFAPKRILSLDGGGTRGIIEIAYLERIEQLLAARSGRGDAFRLSDYFDLIGGTSTGAIVATALALGMPAAKIRDLYLQVGKRVFRRPPFRLPGFGPKFHSRGLEKLLAEVLGERTLDTSDLKTGLAIIAKRLDTGSPWVLTNNPRSSFWNNAQTNVEGNRDPFGNRYYKLRDVVRASTAAPYYFAPKTIRIGNDETGVFVDGAVSPHNNPALQVFMLAGIKGYGFNWPIDRDKLFLLSIGTGWVRPLLSIESAGRMPSALLAVQALQGMSWDCQLQTLKLLQWISAARRPWPINSEVGTLAGEILGSELVGRRELLTFQRYDVKFEPGWLKERTGINVSGADLVRLSDFVEPRGMSQLYDIAGKVAEVEVQADDFPSQFDVDHVAHDPRRSNQGVGG